jgi:predicted glycoside hydrolase/deacetylase ChbG (UPF0249 family)
MSRDRKIFAADDWGLSPGINMGILALAKAGLLRSVSCMGNTSFLTVGLRELLSNSGIEFWMHFNLTYGQSRTHGGFLFRMISGRLRTNEIAAEFESQLATLQNLNIPISGVNGHHHVHLWPKVFNAIRPLAGPGKKTKLRLMNDRHHRPTYLQSQYFGMVRPNAAALFALEDCLYLLKNDLRSKEALEHKVTAAGGSPLLSHPALFNDFAETKMADGLQEERVWELKSILEFLS